MLNLDELKEIIVSALLATVVLFVLYVLIVIFH